MSTMFVTLTFLVFFPLSNGELAGEKHHVRSNSVHHFSLESISTKTFSSHNWPDDDCVKILSGVRKAMAPHSRVLVRMSHSNFLCATFEKV